MWNLGVLGRGVALDVLLFEKPCHDGKPLRPKGPLLVTNSFAMLLTKELRARNTTSAYFGQSCHESGSEPLFRLPTDYESASATLRPPSKTTAQNNTGPEFLRASRLLLWKGEPA